MRTENVGTRNYAGAPDYLIVIFLCSMAGWQRREDESCNCRTYHQLLIPLVAHSTQELEGWGGKDKYTEHPLNKGGGGAHFRAGHIAL